MRSKQILDRNTYESTMNPNNMKVLSDSLHTVYLVYNPHNHISFVCIEDFGLKSSVRENKLFLMVCMLYLQQQNETAFTLVRDTIQTY